MPLVKGLRRIAALALPLLLAACAGNSVPASGQSAAGQVTATVGFSLPLPRRESSDLTEHVLLGTDTEARSTGAVDQGTALELPAGNSEYALYRFNFGAETPDSVGILLEAGSTTEAWIGLANYSTNRWEFDGPFTDKKTFSCDNPAYTSPAGNLWVVVLTPAQESALVNALSVRTIGPPNVPPVADLTATPLTGDAPLLVQFDASGSTDSDGEIIEYAWDFDGDGLYDGFSDDPEVTHTYTAAGIFNAKVRVTDDQLDRDSTTVSIDVNVLGNAAPVASFTFTPELLYIGDSVEFDASASSDSDGTIVRYDWDIDGNGTWDAFSETPVFEQTFFAEFSSDEPVLRVTDDRGAQDVLIHVQNFIVGQLPVAALTASATKVEKGETIFLEASGSASYFDDLTDFEWDLDGDKIFNETGAETTYRGLEDAVRTLGSTPGLFDVSVRVTDVLGTKDTETVQITVRGWLLKTIDSTGTVGAYSSLTVINGGPAIGYVDTTNDDLKFAYSSNPDGSSNWVTVVANNTVTVSGDVCLALVDGKPAMSFNLGNTDLGYAYSSSASGGSGWSSVTVDSADAVGDSTSLAVVSGKPAISYHDETNGDLKYAYSSTANGSSGWSSLMVDTANSNYTSLAVVNGFPAISYHDGANLKYAYSNSANGSSGWTALTVDTGGTVGRFTSLAVINNKPAISYTDATNSDLKYAYSNTADGSAGWNDITVFSASTQGEHTSLALVGGRPAIGYRHTGATDLRYAVSSTADGSNPNGWSFEVVDTVAGNVSDVSLCVVNGRPAISYYAITAADLKYAVLFE